MNRLSVADVHSIKGVSRQSVYNAVERGLLHPVEDSNVMQFEAEEVAQWKPKKKAKDKDVEKDLAQVRAIMERRGFSPQLIEQILKERQEFL